MSLPGSVMFDGGTSAPSVCRPNVSLLVPRGRADRRTFRMISTLALFLLGIWHVRRTASRSKAAPSP
jgi:hypothetical protein